MKKILKITERLAETYQEANKILVNYLCKCWRERNYEMFRMFNKKRKYFMERLK